MSRPKRSMKSGIVVALPNIQTRAGFQVRPWDGPPVLEVLGDEALANQHRDLGFLVSIRNQVGVFDNDLGRGLLDLQADLLVLQIIETQVGHVGMQVVGQPGGFPFRRLATLRNAVLHGFQGRFFQLGVGNQGADVQGLGSEE